MAKILRKSQGSIPKLSVFLGHKSIMRHYYIQNVEERIQIQVNKISKERVTHVN